MYKACTEMEAFAIRKKQWEQTVHEEDGYFTECMKINFMYNYNQHIRKPLIKKKELDIERFSRRKDYNQVLVVEHDETEQYQMNQLKIEAFRKIEAKKNKHLEEFMLTRIITNNFNMYIGDIAHFFKRQQRILENVISANNDGIQFKYDVKKMNEIE